MPTWEKTERFERDWRSLNPDEQRRFRVAVRKFVADLAASRFTKGLRVRKVEGTEDIFEMSWAPSGRATFHHGRGRGHGAHIVWRRIGTHDVFQQP